MLGLVVNSQVEMHAKWGGVVPEAAARTHVESILPCLEEALGQAQLSLNHVAAIGVTNRPGLIGALSVGVTAAKALAQLKRIPLIGVHHLEGHLLSPYLSAEPGLPHLSLIVSGGHTELVHVQSSGEVRIVAETVDDAAGEAFDKSARLLGLGYPGGRALSDLAEGGNPRRYALPRSLPRDAEKFSFSGLKTAVRRLIEVEGDRLDRRDAAASIQAAVVDALVQKAILVAESLDSGLWGITLCGGVAANRLLRSELERECLRRGWGFATPDPVYCTDNAAMIGLAASVRLAAGQWDSCSELDVFSNASLPSTHHIQG